MATGMTNGTTNGLNGHGPNGALKSRERFSDIPPAIDIAVSEGGDEEAVEVDLVELLDDPTELCTLLENENVAKSSWITIALAYARDRKVDHAIDILSKAMGALSKGRADEKLSICTAQCWLYLHKSREAPRVKPEGQLASEARTKEFYLHAATTTLNEASRISPSYPPLFLAKGVLYLLRASLQAPSKAASGAPDNSERVETYRSANKCFDDALRASNGKNLMAVLGKARVQYALGKYADALQCYQTVLEQAPDLTDPDPRIGIGCCFWQLNFKDDAKQAWQRVLELNPQSKVANTLLGMYYLHQSSQYATTDERFKQPYTKGVTHLQAAYKMDDEQHPLTCSHFGSYFLMRKLLGNAEKLARRAIELTDVNAIASDGWYLLARKEHYEGNIPKATEFYAKADLARGGEERGYLPAKFGTAQIKVIHQDYEAAKFQLEKIIQQSKSAEALTLLGTLYAEEVFTAMAADPKDREDKSSELKKATSLLEAVRQMWMDPDKNVEKDSSVLLNLARLYELDRPEKSLQCLQQVEQIEMDLIEEDDRPNDIADEATLRAYLREFLPPQLLNNLACFHFQYERFSLARELFQSSLNACVKVSEKSELIDTDALVTTISYNLARTYEAEGMLDQAKDVYEGLLKRHPGYTDARTRLTYIALQQLPDEGQRNMKQLFQDEPDDREVRALYGWYLHRAKKRTMNAAEDQEQKHYKQTLSKFDSHEPYSLTGMGNIWLTIAREMKRDTDRDKDQRHKTYEKAVQFFDASLMYDKRDAYAAQGIGIALAEDKRDFTSAVQIFTNVKETLKDANVFINLGHAFCELKQFSRAVDNYELALAKDRAKDQTVLSCLGRAWLLRGKAEKSVAAMKESLEYSRRALEVAPDSVHFKFNVAYVGFQIAQLIYSLPDSQRTLEDVEAAATGLDEAIQSFRAIAQSPNPPFPPGDIEARANMGQNTMRRQLERAVQSQREYEEKNAAKLRHAREVREEDMRKREAERKAAEEAEAERKRQIAEERAKIQERDRQLAIIRAEEARKREEAEMTEDSETGEKIKRTKRKGGKRKKTTDDIETTGDTDGDADERVRQRNGAASGASGEGGRPKKKRRLRERFRPAASKKQSKYPKSSEFIGDSSSDSDVPMDDTNSLNSPDFGRRDEGHDGAVPRTDEDGGGDGERGESGDALGGDQGSAHQGGDRVSDDSDVPVAAAPRRKAARVIEEDDDEEPSDAG